MKSRAKKYWEYFFIYYVFTCAVIPYDFYTGQADATLFSIIELIAIIFGTLGLYGFIYQKPLIHQTFWKLFCLPFIATLSYSFYGMVFKDFQGNISVAVVVVLIAFILIVPFTYAMVKYAFFSSNAWASGT